jgi:hypothetical protein
VGKYVGDDPHMRVVVEGKTGRLDGKILHYTMENFSEHLRRLDAYGDIYAKNQRQASAKFCIFPMLFRPPARFLKSYVFKGGFLDGLPGFIIAVTSAFTVFTRYVKFWERRNS